MYNGVVTGIKSGVSYLVHNGMPVAVTDVAKRYPKWYEKKTIVTTGGSAPVLDNVEISVDECAIKLSAVKKQVAGIAVCNIKGISIPINKDSITGLNEAKDSGWALVSWKVSKGVTAELSVDDIDSALKYMNNWKQEQFYIESTYLKLFKSGVRFPLDITVWNLTSVNAILTKQGV